MGLNPLHNPGNPRTLQLGGLEVTAFSISGLATYVLVPAFDACFDLGHCPTEAVKLRHVFLTHVHQDHSAGALRHLSMRRMFGARPSRIYVPEESAAALTDVFRAFERLEEKPASDLAAVIHPVAVGAKIRLSARYAVTAFDVVHRIASRGYTVVESRSKLRPEFEGRPAVEIQAARLRGATVADVTDVPVFTYVGDSTHETLRRHPEVGQSEVLFLEVTHLPSTARSVSAEWGHTHLDDLVELARENPAALASRHIVLKHFSMRYDAREIRRALDAFPEDLRRRITLLI